MIICVKGDLGNPIQICLSKLARQNAFANYTGAELVPFATDLDKVCANLLGSETLPNFVPFNGYNMPYAAFSQSLGQAVESVLGLDIWYLTLINAIKDVLKRDHIAVVSEIYGIEDAAMLARHFKDTTIHTVAVINDAPETDYDMCFDLSKINPTNAAASFCVALLSGDI